LPGTHQPVLSAGDERCGAARDALLLAQRHVQEPRVPDRQGLAGAAGQRGDPDRRPEIIETATAVGRRLLEPGSWILRKAPGQCRAVRARRRRGSGASHHGGRTSSATRVGLSDGISGRRRHQRVPPAPPGRLGPPGGRGHHLTCGHLAPQKSHKSGSGRVGPHRNPTDETALPGTRRHGC
jgi:hypothetical protein